MIRMDLPVESGDLTAWRGEDTAVFGFLLDQILQCNARQCTKSMRRSMAVWNLTDHGLGGYDGRFRAHESR